MAFDFVTLLGDWESLGVFDYVLPFLLIFAVVYGILAATNVFSGNKGVNLVVALAVALLALRFDYVPVFFSEIFPRFGVGLAVYIVLMIFAVLLVPKSWMKGFSGTMIGVGAIIGLVVVYKAFDFTGWSLSNTGWWEQYGSMIILIVLIAALVFFIAKDKIEIKGGKDAEYTKYRQNE